MQETEKGMYWEADVADPHKKVLRFNKEPRMNMLDTEGQVQDSRRITASYYQRSLESGLHVGMPVRVTSAASTNEAGWSGRWLYRMTTLLGTVGRVTSINHTTGVTVEFGMFSEVFPCFVLSPVEVPESVITKPESSVPKTESVAPGIDQIPYEGIEAIGAIFAEGEPKYGRDNWKKAPDHEDYDRERSRHAMRHLWLWVNGDRSEPHLAKVAWFCFTQIWREKNRNGNNRK